MRVLGLYSRHRGARRSFFPVANPHVVRASSRDKQQDLPFGWCPVCGAEIWREGAGTCEDCEHEQA